LINIQKENLPDGSNKFTMSEETNKVINSQKYIEFVRETTSPASSDFAALLSRLTELEVTYDVDVSRLMTAALGVSAEAGELAEIIKKIFLQGKPYNEDNVLHMKKEAGDILWYMSQLCIALDTTFEELMEINYQKLSSRYPEGTFSVHKSENRVEGDL
jgi:NTP pyrophosphatase (non-canonical NTP hydrolase)